MRQSSLDKFILETIEIEKEAARDAGTIGYMTRSLVQATLPHSDPKSNVFERKNGKFSLTIVAPPKIGLPYGCIPRLLISFLATEAVRTQCPTIGLGRSLREFTKSIQMASTGGANGTITALKKQMLRLFACSITCTFDGPNVSKLTNITLADEVELWWEPQDPNQRSLWESSVVLSPRFFKEIIDNPVPVDLRALKALRRSPLALDIYCWLTHRMFYLRRRVLIPWLSLQLQFGADYPQTSQGQRNFKKKFVLALKKVCEVYHRANVTPEQSGLILLPSPPHVATAAN